MKKIAILIIITTLFSCFENTNKKDEIKKDYLYKITKLNFQDKEEKVSYFEYFESNIVKEYEIENKENYWLSRYEYSNQVIKKTKYDKYEKLQNYTETIINADNTIQSEIVYDSTNNIKYFYEYSYLNDKKIREKKEYNSLGNYTKQYIYEYNNLGQILNIIVKTNDGTLLFTENYLYIDIFEVKKDGFEIQNETNRCYLVYSNENLENLILLKNNKDEYLIEKINWDKELNTNIIEEYTINGKIEQLNKEISININVNLTGELYGPMDFYEAIGMGAPSDSAPNKAARKQTAYEAAKRAAQNEIASYLYGIKLENGLTVQDAMIIDLNLKTEVEAFLRGVEIIRREWDEEDACVVIARININEFKKKFIELGF